MPVQRKACPRNCIQAMKLVIYIHSLSSGGAERVTATLANHWAQKDWYVVVVTVTGGGHDFYDLNERIRRIALSLAAESSNLFQAVLNNLHRIWTLRRILLQEKPDVAMSMMTTANVIMAISARLARVPVIGSERTYPPAMPLGRFWEFARRNVYPLLDCIVGQTNDSASWISEHAPAKRITVIPNPVTFPLTAHSPNVSPAQVVSALRCEKLILAVGRLGEEKRFERLLTAFSAQVNRHPDWALVIIGCGRLRETLIQHAINLDISNKVALPGVVGNIGEWYEAADLYVLTSRFEGFPNALLEALAYGVPAVAVDCETGPSEILRHEIDGLLVPQDDPSSLEAALDRMMSDAKLRAEYAQRAVEVRSRFSVEKIADMWEALFVDVIQ